MQTKRTSCLYACATAIALGLLTLSASAAEPNRHIASKLTTATKPVVRVLTTEERALMKANQVSFDLSVDPNQVVCRKERVSSGSRLMTRRCKTVAEFRDADDKARNRSGMVMDNAKRRFATRTRGNEQRQSRLPVTRR